MLTHSAAEIRYIRYLFCLQQCMALNAGYFAVKIIKLSRTAKLIHKKPYICILKKVTSKMEKQPLNRFR